MSHFIITGASGGSPNRLEINDFVKNEKYFSLFIQALAAMQLEDQDHIPSFFSVGKIHGRPYRVWDGAVGEQPWDPDTAFGGYCTHGSTLFPTWHRPYMMLYEQILQSHAVQIAKTYTVDRPAWVKAAQELRHPFWDWALNAVPPDEVIALKKVAITGPDGKTKTVDNPIYRYTFHPIEPSFPTPYNSWKTTFRHPTTRDPFAIDNVPKMKKVLRAAQYDITSSTYNMLTRVHDWAAFSNHTVGDGGSTSNSLEAIHDGIHFDIGGGGQMSDPSVAAFDPVFFLHHCNVDRMLQLWSALNPDVWVTPNDSDDGTFTIPPSTTIDTNTALTPFWNGQTSFWVSDAVKNTNVLGYSYPDFNGLDLGNPDAVKSAIAQRVNELYGSSIFDIAGPASVPLPLSSINPDSEPKQSVSIPKSTTTIRSRAAPDATKGRELGHTTSQVAQPTVPTHEPQPKFSYDLVPPGFGPYDWTTRIEVKKYELGCSFAVLIFMGEVPSDYRHWLVSPNLVGKYQTFVNTSASHCANCRKQKEITTEGFVHLNTWIIKHSGLNTSEPNVVEQYLRENLHWRVLKADHEPATVNSLEVSVYVTPLSYPPGADFPVPGERTRRNGITYRHDGGSFA